MIPSLPQYADWLFRLSMVFILTLMFAVATEAKPPTVLTLDTLDDWLLSNAKETVERIKAAQEGTFNPRVKTDVQWFASSKHYRFKTKTDQAAEIQRLETELTSPTLPPLPLAKLVRGQVGTFCTEFDNGYRRGSVGEKPASLYVVWFQPPAERQNLPMFIYYIQQPKDVPWGKWEGKISDGLRSADGFPGTYIVLGERKMINNFHNSDWPIKVKNAIQAGQRPMIPMLHEYDLTPHLKKIWGQPAK